MYQPKGFFFFWFIQKLQSWDSVWSAQRLLSLNTPLGFANVEVTKNYSTFLSYQSIHLQVFCENNLLAIPLGYVQ